MDAAAILLPDGLDALAALFLIVASFFTSALMAAFGVGGGIAMLALLGLFLPVAALIPVHGAVQLGSNAGRAWYQRAHIRRGIALPFVLGSMVGAGVGVFVVVQLPDAVLRLVLGLFILAVTWARVPGAAGLSQAGIAVGSTVLAVISMFVGATGPLLIGFLSQIIPEDRRALIATHAAGMSVQHLFKVIAFAFAGFAFARWLPLVLAMIATGYLGTVYGSRLLEKLPEKRFRRWFRIALTLLALDFLRRGLMGLL